MDDLSYENLVTKFFKKQNELFASKSQRIENCLSFVNETVSYTSKHAVEVIRKRITSLDLTFMKKWRDSKFDWISFRQSNEEWLHRSLQVHFAEVILNGTDKYC